MTIACRLVSRASHSIVTALLSRIVGHRQVAGRGGDRIHMARHDARSSCMSGVVRRI